MGIFKKLYTALFIALLLPVLTFAQSGDESEEAAESLYLVMNVKPLNNNISSFESALAEHNREYHTEFPMQVFWIATGDTYSGYYQIVHGPTNWTNLGMYQASDEHNTHWNDEVMTKVEDASGYSFWQLIPEYALNPQEEIVPASFVEIFTIKSNQMSRFMKLIDEWHEANIEEEFDGSYGVLSRQMSGTGQVALVVNLPEGWSELDESPNFREKFENTHGKPNWDVFREDMGRTIERVEIAMRFYRPDLSTAAEN